MLAELHVMLSRLRAFLGRGFAEREFDDEIQFHLDMSETEHVRGGLQPEEARRRARVEFGGIAQVREYRKEFQGIPWLDSLGLDFRLAIRMLRKSLGLTLVGGLAMTVVMVIATAGFALIAPNLYSTLPLEEGDRVVALMVWDGNAQRQRRPSMENFVGWASNLTSFDQISATRTVARNAATSDGALPQPVSVAQMTASGFELARVEPLMGRSIVATDELPGAEPVVLIGYDVWQSNFAADPRVVGRTLRLDDVTHTVIGVMPPEFAFPINDRYWTPLRTDTVGDVLVFARLRPEIDIASAGAELAALGFTSEHAAAEGPLLPVTHVVPYTRAFSTGEPLEDVLLTFGVWLLGLVLVPPCANIAILVYARTISRQHEFTTRVALGASRSRIVGQLFIETLVLASMSALAALVMLRLGFSMRFFSSTNDPFWIEYDLLSPQIVLFAAGLAVFAALIAGGIPAIQATRRTSEAARVLSGTDGLHLGWSWTGMVVAQIAFSLMILPTAIEAAWGLMQPSIIDPGFIPEDYLIASVAMSDDGADDGRLARQVAAFRNRIGAEPGVVGMALSSNPPGLEAPNAVVLEVEGVGASRATGETETHQVQVNPIDPAFMELFPMTLQAGRVPAAAPDGVEVREVLVNGNFIASTGAGLGSRLRHLWGPQSAPDLWFDIVGIVDDVPRNTGSARLYHMGTPAPVGTRTLSIRTLANPGAFANQLRDIASTVDPRLRVSDVRRLDLAYSDGPVGFSLILAQIVAGTTASLLLLGAAGLYALMSFTIARKRREIGIRAALGAQSGKLLAGIFRNTLMRVLAGALVGLVLALAIERLLSPILHGIDLDGGIGIRDIPGIVPAAALVMILVGIGAAVGPSRRGPAIWTDASFRRRFPSCSRRETDNASSLS